MARSPSWPPSRPRPTVPMVAGPGEATLLSFGTKTVAKGLSASLQSGPETQARRTSVVTSHTHSPPLPAGSRAKGPRPVHAPQMAGPAGGEEDTARGSGAQCLAGSTRLRTRVTAKAQPPGTGQGCGPVGNQGTGPPARPRGPRRRGLWDRQRESHTRTPGTHHTHTHAYQAHTRGWSTRPRLQQWSTTAGKEQPPEGLVSEALTFASVSGSFFHF